MNSFLIILMGIGFAVVGGRIGLRSLLYISVAALAGFAAVRANVAFFEPLSLHFMTITSRINAEVVAFVTITMTSTLLVGFLGHKHITAIKIDENIPHLVNAVLGSGYAVSAFLAFVAVKL